MASLRQRVERFSRHFPWFGYVLAGLVVFFGPWVLWVLNAASSNSFLSLLFFILALLLWIVGIIGLLFFGAGHALMRLVFPKTITPPPIPESAPPTPAEVQAQLAASLTPPERDRHVRLAANCQRLRSTAHTVDDRTTTASLDAGLDRLTWTHLKLLLARHQFTADRAAETAEELRGRIATLLSRENDALISSDARASITATRHLTEERLRRRQELEMRQTEIEADLARIEAEVALAIDRAAFDTTHVRLGLSGSLAADVLQSVNWSGAQLPQVQAVDRVLEAQ